MPQPTEQISEKQRRIHKNSIANLKPFVRGKSGNPGGVKKGTIFISEAYKRMLAMSPEELKRYKPKSVAEEIAMRQAKDARGDLPLQPSLPAAREIADRTEGKAPQTV